MSLITGTNETMNPSANQVPHQPPFYSFPDRKITMNGLLNKLLERGNRKQEARKKNELNKRNFKLEANILGQCLMDES